MDFLPGARVPWKFDLITNMIFHAKFSHITDFFDSCATLSCFTRDQSSLSIASSSVYDDDDDDNDDEPRFSVLVD